MRDDEQKGDVSTQWPSGFIHECDECGRAIDCAHAAAAEEAVELLELAKDRDEGISPDNVIDVLMRPYNALREAVR